MLNFCLQAPFIIEMEISALLLVDIHSLASPSCEVIGLLGGTYDYDHKVLSISSAVPCRTTLSNNVHCDMCPGMCIYLLLLWLIMVTEL